MRAHSAHSQLNHGQKQQQLYFYFTPIMLPLHSKIWANFYQLFLSFCPHMLASEWAVSSTSPRAIFGDWMWATNMEVVEQKQLSWSNPIERKNWPEMNTDRAVQIKPCIVKWIEESLILERKTRICVYRANAATEKEKSKMKTVHMFWNGYHTQRGARKHQTMKKKTISNKMIGKCVLILLLYI